MSDKKPVRFWPLTVATALMFVFLMSLGIWQVQRLAWKEGLIADITARQQADPVSIATAVKTHSDGEDVRYLRVRARGTFLHADERYFYQPDPKLGPGFDVYTPFKLSNGQGVIIVNRGYVPEPLKHPEQRSNGQVDGEQELVGLIRVDGPVNMFTPDNDPAGNLWFRRDFAAMVEGVADASTEKALGLFVESEVGAPGGFPRGGIRKIALSNRHFGYAMTWFGLALTVLGVYAAMLWGRRRN